VEKVDVDRPFSHRAEDGAGKRGSRIHRLALGGQRLKETGLRNDRRKLAEDTLQLKVRDNIATDLANIQNRDVAELPLVAAPLVERVFLNAGAQRLDQLRPPVQQGVECADRRVGNTFDCGIVGVDDKGALVERCRLIQLTAKEVAIANTGMARDIFSWRVNS
jgi:hypothetical protein